VREDIEKVIGVKEVYWKSKSVAGNKGEVIEEVIEEVIKEVIEDVIWSSQGSLEIWKKSLSATRGHWNIERVARV